MDLAFSRRTRLQPIALDLAGLLATVSARQAASPTAQAHARLNGRETPENTTNPMLSLLTGEASLSTPSCGSASFAARFSPRQQS
jgi:hypothetical protein